MSAESDRLARVAELYLSPEEISRFEAEVSRLVGEAYKDGKRRVEAQLPLGLRDEDVEPSLERYAETRRALARAAIGRYIESVREFSRVARLSGLEGPLLRQASDSFASTLADRRADIVVNVEYGSGRAQGVKDSVKQGGEPEVVYEFEHMLTGSPDHEECPICEELRERGQMTPEEAEAAGFPEYPHPFCDHGFLMHVKEAA